MSEQNKDEQIPDEAAGIYKLWQEIESERMRLKARPPKSVDDLVTWFLGTGMSLMRDHAYYTLQHAGFIDELFDRTADAETSFTPEDAEDFKFVIGYAQGQATLALQDTTMTAEQREILQRVIDKSKHCLEVIEEAMAELEPEEPEATP